MYSDLTLWTLASALVEWPLVVCVQLWLSTLVIISSSNSTAEVIHPEILTTEGSRLESQRTQPAVKRLGPELRYWSDHGQERVLMDTATSMDLISAVYAAKMGLLPHTTKAAADVVYTYAIPILLQDSHKNVCFADALGDFCAKHNFLSSKLATKLGLSLDKRESSTITIGSGKKIKTLGTPTTPFSFKKEAASYKLKFHVLHDCVQDVVLGKAFLIASRTPSSSKNLASRVKKSIGKRMSRSRLFFLGDSAPRFTGAINGLPGNALADCGSNVLVMDEDYALRLGLSIDRGQRAWLQFADGSGKYTTGMTSGVRWQFGPGIYAQQHYLILKDAPAPVILSDTFLFGTEAYSRYECYLMDNDEVNMLEEDDDGYFCLIRMDPTHIPEGSIDFSSLSNRRHVETCLRGQIRKKIAKLPASERDAARQAEEERQHKWQEEMDALERAQTASAQQQALANPPAAPAPAPATTATPQSLGSPPKWRSFWLKLRRQKGQKPATTRP